MDKSDLALSSYRALVRDNTLIMRTIGHYCLGERGYIEVFVEKKIRIHGSGEKPGLAIHYLSVNQGSKPIDTLIGLEYTETTETKDG